MQADTRPVRRTCAAQLINTAVELPFVKMVEPFVNTDSPGFGTDSIEAADVPSCCCM